MGDFATSGCSCHGPNSIATTLGVQVLDSATGLPPAGGLYIPGGAYTLAVTGNNINSALTAFGFQIRAVTSSGMDAGVLTIRVPAQTQVFTDRTVDDVEHSTPIPRSAGIFSIAKIENINAYTTHFRTELREIQLEAAKNIEKYHNIQSMEHGPAGLYGR